jgi:serine/threonine-protein kinase
MIRTYVGDHVELERTVTIKRLVVGDRRGRMVEDTRARFLREAAELARLSHPNIVRIYERGEVDGVPFIVTERISGVSLSRYLAEIEITPSLAIDIVDEICRALGVAHSIGIVHQGLKPDAVYLRSDATGELVVRLVDFGVADDFHTLTHSDDRLRVTPWYVAPEQARREPADARTDIYGMGCLLCRLWAGRTPFEHLIGPSVLVAHVRLPPPSLQELDPTGQLPGIFEWTVQRCLAKDPGERFGSVAELRRALQLCRLALLRPDLRLSPRLVDGTLHLDEQLDPLLLGSELVLTV